MVIVNEKKDTELLKSDFDYELPPELIAQHPAQQRDNCRLLVVDKKTGEYRDRVFHDITEYIKPGDVLVINDSKVIPARLLGKKADSGIPIEVLRRFSRKATGGE